MLCLVGDEAASILHVVMEANDHRLLANALEKLADYQEASS